MTIKRALIFFLIVSIGAAFSFSSGGNGKKETHYTFKVVDKPFSKSNSIDPEKDRMKHRRYLDRQKRKRDKWMKQRDFIGPSDMQAESEKGISGVSAVQIEAETNNMNSVSDYSGDLVFMGVCINNGTSPAVFVEVNATFKNSSGGIVGKDWSYVQGGHNVRLSGTGSYTNALGQGEYGFFMIWTNIPRSSVSDIDYTFSYQTYSHTSAMASVDFVGDPYFSADYSGDLKVSGSMRNSSYAYLTYFTEVYFAIFSGSQRTLDVDSTYVDGSSYNTGVVTTDTALFPGESGGFLNYFTFASFSDAQLYMYSFEWDEAAYSTPGEKDPPFGSFDTPLEGSTVASSIAVTGWALDDTGIDSIKLYRQDGKSLVYIGDALQVEGARPDVAAAYPGYPYNTQAGWGYMLLTNFLPGGGNGTFTLEVVATDKAGKTTSLGTKTIVVDNANAVKPFGAIDTPAQGGTASGGTFINWGWALTPLPKTIPTDGSTINVFVDGVNLGHPTYNIYRSDIATLFSGYNNSNGAIGYFKLDTTTYSSGVHTIQWTARDNEGASDGIGSRYFSISNPRTTSHQASAPLPELSDIIRLPLDKETVIAFRQGYDDGAKMNKAGAHLDGIALISLTDKGRLVLDLKSGDKKKTSDVSYDGYLLINGKVSGLPAGSTLNGDSGTFYWMPGPAFRGRFPLVFVKTGADGRQTRSMVFVDIR